MMRSGDVIVDKRSKEKIDRVLRTHKEVSAAFDRAVGRLKYNCFAGNNIRKERFPPKIVKEFHPTNLYVYDLIRSNPGWRMIYTITNDNKVKILVVVLSVLDHTEYERMFGYD
jgi:hypothetical protein